jgi:Universal stress protein family
VTASRRALAQATIRLGSRGYGPVRRVLLGSTSNALMRSARCPVIVYPRGMEPGEGGFTDPEMAQADSLS